MRLERYCKCGGKLRIKIDRDKRDAILSQWFSYHTGEGHAPTTRKQAQEARKQNGHV